MIVLFLVSVLATGFSASGFLLTSPITTADVAGARDVVLECSSSLGTGNINWTFTPFTLGASSQNTTRRIATGGSLVASTDSQNYRVDRPSADSCNLVIIELSNEVMGTYRCIDDHMFAEAQLVSMPFPLSVQPLFGPIAGGTNVTITGDALGLFYTVYLHSIFRSSLSFTPSAFFFGRNITSSNIWSNLTDSANAFIIAETPAVDKDLIGKPLTIVVEFKDSKYNVSVNRNFTYRDNPQITDISPKQFVVTGGTMLTVHGTDLSSVAEPLMRVQVVVSRSNHSTPNIDTYVQRCSAVNDSGSSLLCQMPAVNIPDDFLSTMDDQYHNHSKEDGRGKRGAELEQPFLVRHRRDATAALSITGTNGVDRVDVYIGFIFDGYKDYDNINNALPDTTVAFYSPPEIPSMKNLIRFDANKDDTITIEGKHMTRGCRMDDYSVFVGSELCRNLNLTDNLLLCRPPKSEPKATFNDSIYCDQSLDISVNIGFKHFQYACLKYSADVPNIPLGLIVGLTVGVGLPLLVLLLILFVILLIRCLRRNERKPDGRQFYRNQNQQETHSQMDNESVYSVSQSTNRYDNQTNNNVPQLEDRGYLDLYGSNTGQEEGAYYTRTGSEPQDEDYVNPNGWSKQPVSHQANDKENKRTAPPPVPKRKPDANYLNENHLQQKNTSFKTLYAPTSEYGT